jgi:hypothetical protein
MTRGISRTSKPFFIREYPEGHKGREETRRKAIEANPVRTQNMIGFSSRHFASFADNPVFDF